MNKTLAIELQDLREQIAQDIERRICDVVHNETAPQTCILTNEVLRIAAFIARGQK